MRYIHLDQEIIRTYNIDRIDFVSINLIDNMEKNHKVLIRQSTTLSVNRQWCENMFHYFIPMSCR